MNKRGTMLYPEEDARYIEFTPEQLQALADLYRAGHSTRKLASRYGISACTVRRRLLSMGVAIRGRGRLKVTDQVISVALHLLEGGAGWRVVSWATSVQADSIMNAMRRQRTRSSAE